MSDNPTDRTQSTGDAGSTSAATGAATQTATPSAVSDKTFTQADVDRIVSERIAREKDAEKERSRKAAEQAREQERIKAGEIQAVAEERAARLAEIEPKVESLTAQIESANSLIDKLMQPRIKALPEGFQNILKRAKDVTERVEMLGELEKEAERSAAQRSPGTPSGPRGSGAQTATVPAVLPRRPVGDGF